MKALLFGMILASATFAADVTGMWNGTFTTLRQDGSMEESKPAFLELKQDGEKVSGKVGQDTDHAFELSEGQVKADVVTMTAAMPEGTLKITLTLKEGKLEGEVIMERGGEKRKALLKFAK